MLNGQLQRSARVLNHSVYLEVNKVEIMNNKCFD